MIRHIVIWRLEDTEDKLKKALAIKTELEALKSKINVIRNIQVGININTTEAASDIVLVSDFDSAEDLNTYINHPDHKAVGTNFVRPNVSERRVVDYEF